MLTDRLGGLSVSGVFAGLVAAMVCPLYFGSLLAIVSVPAYLPFRITSRLLRNMKIVVDNSDTK